MIVNAAKEVTQTSALANNILFFNLGRGDTDVGFVIILLTILFCVIKL
jgi:hypothetical protein